MAGGLLGPQVTSTEPQVLTAEQSEQSELQGNASSKVIVWAKRLEGIGDDTLGFIAVPLVVGKMSTR